MDFWSHIAIQGAYMTEKSLTSEYKPELAKSKLTKYFGDKVSLVEINNSLTDLNRIALAAMCDGKTITSSGNNVHADFEVTRAPAIADTLVNEFNLPITRQRIETVSETGNKASQSLYYIEDSALEELLNNPDEVLSRNKKKNDMKAWGRSERDLKRLVQRFGVEDIISYLSAMHSSNDDTPSNKAS
ncbi:hypothetical protein N499_1390 [Wolbachia pipientis wVitA]|nr:hypothetical protein N499_1390 [Wolbachia pipientis wVitA]